MMIHRLVGWFLLFWLFASPLPAQETPQASPTPSLEEIDRQLNNPLAKTWAFVLQNNIGIHEIDGSEVSNNPFFQPSMPFGAL